MQWKHLVNTAWPCGYGLLSVDWLGILWRVNRAPMPWDLSYTLAVPIWGLPLGGPTELVACVWGSTSSDCVSYFTEGVALSSFSTNYSLVIPLIIQRASWFPSRWFAAVTKSIRSRCFLLIIFLKCWLQLTRLFSFCLLLLFLLSLPLPTSLPSPLPLPCPFLSPLPSSFCRYYCYLFNLPSSSPLPSSLISSIPLPLPSSLLLRTLLFYVFGRGPFEGSLYLLISEVSLVFLLCFTLMSTILSLIFLC